MRVVALLVMLGVSGCGSDENVAASAASTADAEPSALANPCAELDGFAALSCAKPEWRSRDNELNRMLARVQARASHSAKADLRTAQRRWEGQRDECLARARPEREPCLESVYGERMNELVDALN